MGPRDRGRAGRVSTFECGLGVGRPWCRGAPPTMNGIIQENSLPASGFTVKGRRKSEAWAAPGGSKRRRGGGRIRSSLLVIHGRGGLLSSFTSSPNWAARPLSHAQSAPCPAAPIDRFDRCFNDRIDRFIRIERRRAAAVSISASSPLLLFLLLFRSTARQPALAGRPHSLPNYHDKATNDTHKRSL